MKIIEIDSQILNAIQGCPTKHQYQFLENLQVENKAAALEKGSLLHKILELYDGLMGKCEDIESDTWSELRDTEIYARFTAIGAERKTEDIIQFCLDAGRFFASKSNLDTEVAESVIFQCKEYFEYYKNDPWMTLAVEEIASKVIFENEELKIVYTGKLDRLVQQGNIIAPMDHKSSDKRTETNSLSNQFIGYCALLNTNHIIIDKIGFQKTLAPKERFQRIILNVDEARINEWVNNTIDTVLNHLSLTVEDEMESLYYFKLLRNRRDLKPLMNLTHCDKYSGCTYRFICENNPEGRDWMKERDYIVGKSWDVGSILEAK
jgi:hypothetical protein